jgi:hypothetical protein
MKKLRIWSLAVAGVTALSSTHAATFDDVQFWVGSGANQAALVIDWNDGKTYESLLWGYRWDGSATGLDMFHAVVNADPRVFSHLGVYSFGTAVLGVGFDLSGDNSIAVTPTLNFDSYGWLAEANPTDSHVSLNPVDHWEEGFSTGYWSYYIKASAGALWDYSMVGPGDRLLVDGMWDGYSFAPGFIDTVPSEPTAVSAVPEPSSLSLLLISALAIVCVRRRH